MANAITGLSGGQIPVIVALGSDLMPLYKDGSIRVIATTDADRWADVKPTGISPDELARIQVADLAKWGPIIKATGPVIRVASPRSRQ